MSPSRAICSFPSRYRRPADFTEAAELSQVIKSSQLNNWLYSFYYIIHCLLVKLWTIFKLMGMPPTPKFNSSIGVIIHQILFPFDSLENEFSSTKMSLTEEYISFFILSENAS